VKITFIGHASLLVEAGGVIILSDPWWSGPCFGAQWWNYPRPFLGPLEGCHVDYIYISHGHHDHLHPRTLRRLNRDAKVLVAAGGGLAPSIRALGFEVIQVNDGQPVMLGDRGLKCRIMESHADDTLMTLDDGDESCVNLNDALHSAPDEVQRAILVRLKAIHPKIDYVFCGYGVASHFPNCYFIPGKDGLGTAVRRQQYFNRQWARLIGQLNPIFGFPFAADVVFFEDELFWLNEVTHNSERPTQVFRMLYPGAEVVTRDIAPGFIINNHTVTSDIVRQPIRGSELRTSCAAEIDRANRYGNVDENSVRDVIALLTANLDACAASLESFDGNYRILVRFRSSNLGILFEKDGGRVSLVPIDANSVQGFDLIFTTRLPYLRWALTRQYGEEAIFVGSGGIFEYTSAVSAKKNLHRELIALVRNQTHRTGNANRSQFVDQVKKLMNRILGLTKPDLYDLDEWTVYQDKQS
jgi:hypothetical protein